MYQAIKSRVSNLLSPILERKEEGTSARNHLKRCLDQEECAGTPSKRSRNIDQVSPTFDILHGWRFRNLFSYITTGKKNRNLNSGSQYSEQFSNEMIHMKKDDGRDILPASRRKNRPRVPFSQISDSTVLDLTRADDTEQFGRTRVPLSQISNSTVLGLTCLEDDDRMINETLEITKVVQSKNKNKNENIEITRVVPSNVDHRRNYVGPLSRQKSSGYLEEVVRLDEKKRYQEILAQFTTVVLPDYSESISPRSSKEKFDTGEEPIATISSSSLFQKYAIKKPVAIDLTTFDYENRTHSRFNLSKSDNKNIDCLQIDLTKSDKKNKDRPRGRFIDQAMQQSKRSSSVPEYSQLEDLSNLDQNNLTKTSEHSRTVQNALLDSSWISRWKDTLDPLQLERERQIKQEERRKEMIKRKQKEEYERLQKKLEEESASNEFPELSESMLVKVKDVFSSGNPQEVFVQAFNAEITRSDLSTLRNATWLNDEVVNFYFNLLKERSETKKEYPKVHVFNTFFYPKITKTGHAGVKRWTRKVDIFLMDMILIPVHLGMHWCLAVIDFKNKRIAYYDSLKGNNLQCLSALKKYLQGESMDKKKKDFDFDGWTEIMPKGIPEQLNGCDCGVFMCKYAEYKSRNAKFTFTQNHMPYFRERMIYEIIAKQLL